MDSVGFQGQLSKLPSLRGEMSKSPTALGRRRHMLPISVFLNGCDESGASESIVIRNGGPSGFLKMCL